MDIVVVSRYAVLKWFPMSSTLPAFPSTQYIEDLKKTNKP